ncbi:hypothetical protein [Pelolinea submarina]|uniref:Uncharacterized protein n=1 Tax=Pelolinea submarina TaxID=913107 RepID=A0A347ZSI6_9CHLR|nr:hypothetical protein [Pelolinea submarina]REG11166.1 hypothetical protein DFR64_1043 [Pelolinea submarina]BBB48267.1 hypothetical protein Pelsub_P1495 [Pelolinea submarina]
MEEKNNYQSQIESSEHSRQTFWQIYFPLLLTGIGAAAILFLLFGKSAGGAVDLRMWADIAAILIILPLFVFLFALIALTFVGSAITYKISTAAKTGLVKIKQTSVRLTHGVESISKGIHRTWEEVDVLYASLLNRYFK